MLAWILGFFEVLIWVHAVSAVLQDGIRSPVIAVAFAFGFATGNYMGITIEQLLAYGEQAVRIFTRQRPEMALALRNLAFGVTQLEGMGRTGRVDVLFVKARRKDTHRVTALARDLDEACFYTVDNIRYSSDAVATSTHAGLRSALKRK